MALGDLLADGLVKELEAKQNLTVTRWAVSPRGKTYRLEGRFDGYIDIHAIANRPHHWGIAKETIDQILSKQKPWCVILIHDSKNTGYVISSKDYYERIAKLWPFHQKQKSYKITEKKSLAGIPRFSSINQLLDLLQEQLAKPFNIEMAFEEAKKEVERIRRGGLGESDSHKELKNFVANHPATVGLQDALSVLVEHPFPSGDKVDVAFEMPNNNWTVVEVELQGLPQTLIGLFQAVKYKALQDAVLRSKNLQGSVEGILVAKSIPTEIKSLAETLAIRTFEIVI